MTVPPFSPDHAIAAFVRALADGADPALAWSAAGLPCDAETALERAQAPDIARRVAALRRADAPAFDPRLLLERCIQWADQAFAHGAAAHQLAAVRAVDVALRLTRAADPHDPPRDAADPGEAAAQPRPLPPLLTDDEWLARYAPAR